MSKLENKTLNEIILDFVRSGLDINMESFKEWFGLKMDDKDFELVGKRIYELS